MHERCNIYMSILYTSNTHAIKIALSHQYAGTQCTHKRYLRLYNYEYILQFRFNLLLFHLFICC